MQGGSGISSACTARGDRWGSASVIAGAGGDEPGLYPGPVGEAKEKMEGRVRARPGLPLLTPALGGGKGRSPPPPPRRCI